MATKVTKCIVCSSKEFELYSEGLIKCNKCGLIVAKELPSSKEINQLYQQEYFFGKEYFDYKADRLALERNFRRRLQRLSFMVQPNFAVVEIGCAYGYFLNMIKDEVRSHLGFDVSQEGISFAKNELGLNVTTEDFSRYHFTPESIDSVFMWDVIEHLVSPETYLHKISEILKPGGHLALTTGNVEAWLPRKRQGKWRMIHPPTHVYYFSSSTLSALVKKYGLEVISVKHPSTSRNIGSVANQIINNGKAQNKSIRHLEFAYYAAKALGADKLNIPINTFDIMEVVVEKK